MLAYISPSNDHTADVVGGVSPETVASVMMDLSSVSPALIASTTFDTPTRMEVTSGEETTAPSAADDRTFLWSTGWSRDHTEGLPASELTTSWRKTVTISDFAGVTGIAADLGSGPSREYDLTDALTATKSAGTSPTFPASEAADEGRTLETLTTESSDDSLVLNLTDTNSTDLYTSHFSSIVNRFYTVAPATDDGALPLTNMAATHSWTFTNATVTSLLELSTASNTSFAFDDVTLVEDGELYDIDDDDAVASTAVVAAKAVTLTLLAVGGVVGNALVIWSVVRQRHLHRPPFYYLLSMSLTDLSRAAFCLPLVLMTLLQGSVWRHGNSACDLFAFANSFFVLSSSVSLLDVAADRHFSLVYARSYRKRAGGAVNLVVVLLGWTLAFLVAFPPVVGVGAYAFQASEAQCALQHKSYRENDTLGFLMVFTGLSLLTLFLYYRIFLALRTHRRMRPFQHEPARSSTWTFVGPGANGQAFVNWVNGFGRANNLLGAPLPSLARNPPRPHLARAVTLHVAQTQHVTRLFFLMTLTFTLLWLPYQVVSYWRVFGDVIGIQSAFVTVSAWLSYAQVALCPLVYFLARGSSRQRQSRTETSPDDKQEFLLESFNRKK